MCDIVAHSPFLFGEHVAESSPESESYALSSNVIGAVRKWSDKGQTDENLENEFTNYRKYILRKWIFMLICTIVIIAVAGYAIVVGSYNISYSESYQIIWNYITGHGDGSVKEYIVVNLRTPRIAVAIIGGAGLAVAGVVMQSTLLNPLADPYTTGISSGASFGAALAITGAITILNNNYGIVVNAFIFSLIPVFAIIAISRIKQTSPTVMIMAGIAIMYIFNALTTVIKLWANPNDLQTLYEWQVGTVSRTSWEEIPLMLAITLAGIIFMQLTSRKLNVLATGEDSANALGVDANKLRTINLLVVSLVTASIVSFTGLIGFVGLVAPHIARIFVGSDNRYLLPCSAFLGAALLVLSDLVGRIVIYPSTLQAGVIMSFLGGPMFLWLIMRRRSQVWA